MILMQFYIQADALGNREEFCLFSFDVYARGEGEDKLAELAKID